jgi:hypothetical protein
VDVFVRKLRQKLRAGSPQWNYIHTHFGVGYRFAPERENSVEEELDLITGGTAATPLESPTPVESPAPPESPAQLDAAARLDSALAG